MQRSWVALAGWICLSLAAGAAGGGVARPGAWYRQLSKPAWNPPDWLFAPVWTVLFVLMGTAAWLVWSRRGSADVRLALGLFVVQLGLNTAWSWLFFGLRRPDLALIDLALLLVAVVATAFLFWRVHPAAGLLLLPYIAWASFAAALNAELLRRNPVGG